MLTKKIYKKDIGRFVLYGIVDKPPIPGLIISTKQVLLKVKANDLRIVDIDNPKRIQFHQDHRIAWPLIQTNYIQENQGIIDTSQVLPQFTHTRRPPCSPTYSPTHYYSLY